MMYQRLPGRRRPAVQADVLGQVVVLAFGGPILIGAAVDDRRGVEVAVRRRRRRTPFERVAVPRIAVHLLAPEEAAEEVDQENDLTQPQDKGADGHEDVEGLEVMQPFEL